jgi:hypothetical protein
LTKIIEKSAQMAYYRDLERCTYFDGDVDPSLDLTAVGWLEAPHPYERGSVSSDFSGRLFALLESVWDPIRFRGKHTCNLCRLESHEQKNDAGQVVDMGATNLFVPKHGDAGLFVAPSLVLHYVSNHSYEPPSEFQDAVMACPGTNSSAYFRRVGRIIPTTEAWRDGLFGYWVSMGAAIAAEAGLMSRSQWHSCFDAFRSGPSTSASDLAAEVPGWFASLYLEPLAALAERLEGEGKSDDARAIGAWMDSVKLLGRRAPSSRLDAAQRIVSEVDGGAFRFVKRDGEVVRERIVKPKA